MKFKVRSRFVAGSVLSLVAIAPSAWPASNVACDKTCLLGFLKSYQAKILQHDAGGIPIAADFRSTENYRPIKPGEGYWRNIANIYHQIQLADPKSGQAVAVGMLNQDGKDGYYSLRIKIEGKKITQSEMFIVKKGEATFFNEDRKAVIDPIYTTSVPRPQRSSREQLLEIVNSFNDSWQYRNEDLTRFAKNCDFYENNVKLNTENGPSGPTCGGIVEYGGKNGVRGTGKAGNAEGQRPPGQNPNAGGSPDGGPPATLRASDPSIGRPELFGSQMWMRDRRDVVADEEHGVVFGYVVQGGEPARPGEEVKYERATPFQAGGAPPPGAGGPGAGGPPPGESGAAYMFALYKIVAGEIVRVDHFEREGGSNASGGFSERPAH